MKLGVFGGSFDPIHYGHLLLAETCREQCALDQVLFVPAATPPHKQSRSRSPARQRVDMVELAIAGYEPMDVSTLEIERGGVSYTVDTLAALQEQYVGAELFFLMGADSLHDLCEWREPQRILEQAVPIVVRRPGSAPPDLTVIAHLVRSERLRQIQSFQVEMPACGLSSTDIRERVAAGRSIRFRTPRAVEQYIEAHQLYRDAVPAAPE